MIEQSLTARLATVAQHIYLGAAPLGYSCPAVVFNRFLTDFDNDLDGNPDHAWAHVQIDVYDEDAEVAIALAKAIRDSFCEWSDDEVVMASITDEAMMTDETTETFLQRVKQEYLLYGALD